MAVLVVALGGNAIASSEGGGTAAEQTATLAAAAAPLAELVAAGHDLVVTHGNGPQVGNLLVKNELAAGVVPAMPLDWCVAQTQATIGFTLATALEEALARLGLDRPVVALVSRVLVDRDDPAFDRPDKPIGRVRADGTRRLVASPAPRALLDERAVRALLAAGAVVIAGGGGGIPMVRTERGLRGVEAVVDKDRAAALLATALHAERLVILTDVPRVLVDRGTDRERPLDRAPAAALRDRLRAGEFPAGSMGPKVEAAVGFAEATGRPAAIGALDELLAVVEGRAGTQVDP